MADARCFAEARSRYSQTFEGNVPGLGNVRVEKDGRVVPVADGDLAET